MSGWLFVIFYIATSPILASILGALVLGAIAFAVLNARAKKRAAQQELEKMVSQMKEREDARHSLITQRYEPEIAQRILNHQIWQGMTAEQLMDSAGVAEAIDTTVTKRGRKEVWKYGQETATRFDTRITLEDGVVVGWQKR
jgi:hypothetical protein